MEQEVKETLSVDAEDVKEKQIIDPAMEQDNKSSEELSQLKSQVEEMQERLQKQSALIGKLSNDKKREEPNGEEPKDVKPKGEIAGYSELEKKIDAFQEKIQKQERAAKLNAIELALVEAGAATSLAKSQAEFLAFKLGSRVKASDDDSGLVVVEIADTDGVAMPVSSWAKSFIESDDGSYMKAHKTGPSVKNHGENSGSGSKVTLSSIEYSKGYSLAHSKGPEAAKAFADSHELG